MVDSHNLNDVSSLELKPESARPIVGIPQSALDELRGRYEFQQMIGQGGMSVLYRARHLLMDKPVVIKLLKKTLSSEAKSVQRFQIEAKATSRLSHTNIAKVTDFGITMDGLAYIVMDYVAGKTLAEILQTDYQLPLKRMLNLSSQLCDALEYAHKHGVLHRDLKPANIMVQVEPDGSELVKIVDFGIAKVAGQDQSLTASGEVFGTPLYMSPEQCTGMALDARSDIYSLGCIMYEMLTGHPPFESSAVLELAHKHIHEPVPALKGRTAEPAPDAVEHLVFKCLAKEADKRYPTMQELGLAVRAILQPQSKSPHWLAPAVILIAVAVIMAAAVAGYIAWHANSPPKSQKPPVYLVNQMPRYRDRVFIRLPAEATDADLPKFLQIRQEKILNARNAPAITDAGLALFAHDNYLKEIWLGGTVNNNNPLITNKVFDSLDTVPLDRYFIDHSNLDLAYFKCANPDGIIELFAGHTMTSEDSVKGMCNLPNLRTLDLAGDNLSDACIDSIVKKFPKVELLKLGQNPKITIAGARKLAVLPLRELHLKGTVAAAHLDELRKLMPHTKIFPRDDV